KTYTLYETAILFESGSYQLLDKIITVYSPIDLRMERTMLRDGISETEVMDRIKNQLPEEDKMKRADFIIYNDLTKSLIEQVLAIHQQLITLDKTI
ncbi:MAG TPA: dephospho-CoA kinase, partial [Chitinophagales bacterium]|nr:dephospho-CoA kinase [Chitinophagales bacterium]